MTLPATNGPFLPTVYTHQVNSEAMTAIFEDTLTGPNSYAVSSSTVYVPVIVQFTPDYNAVLLANATADIATSSAITGAVARLRVSSGTVDHADGAFSTDARRVAFQLNGTISSGTLMQVQLEIPNPTVNVSVKNVRLCVQAIKR